VFDRNLSLLWRVAAPGAMLGTLGAAALLVLPAGAQASTPSTPSSLTSCGGTITPDAGGPAAGNANPYDFSFSCSSLSPGATSPSGYNWNYDGNIYSFSIIVTRRNQDGNNVTYNAPSATVLNASGVDPNQDVNCSSFVPSDGFNCTAPGPNPTAATLSTYSASIGAGETVQGGFALAEPYCSYLPTGAKAGTPAVPRATVELLVTDVNGAQDGPFELTSSVPCKKVAAVVPAKKKSTKKAAKHATARRVAVRVRH
jgi:hypothetical protein